MPLPKADHSETLTDRIAAEREIERVLYDYCRGSDRCDEELLRSVYHDDAIDDHGELFNGPADEFVTMVIPLLKSRFKATMHSLSNIRIDLDGDTATVESHCSAGHLVNGDNQTIRYFACRYVDRFENRPGAGWRIAHRTVVAEWQVQLEGASYPIPPGMTVGTRDRSDASYPADESGDR